MPRAQSVPRAGCTWVMAIVFATAMLRAIAIDAQTNITSSGLGTVVTPSGTTFGITGGTSSSNNLNLFHSFDQFSLATGNTARFGSSINNVVQNIVGRVTGTNASRLLGTIDSRTNFPTANLFLLNSNGFLFGPNASLNVGGAFRASTANSLNFDDNTSFFVDPAKSSAFSGANPRAFVFDSSPVGALPDAGCNLANICVKGVNFNAAVTGKTLSLVGGAVEIVGPATPTVATVGSTGGRDRGGKRCRARERGF